MTRRGFSGLALWAVGVLFVTSPVLAAEERAEVVVEVVHASDAGSTVDAPLAQMKDAFTKSGFNYKSYRRLSREKVSLQKGQTHVVPLPNKREAKLTLTGVKNGAAEVRAEVGPMQTTSTLGREGSVFLQAGPHNGGMLILVLSPPAKG